jgi:hypothetical protein
MKEQIEGFIICKEGRPDIVGIINKYNSLEDEYNISFKSNSGLNWVADWGTYLMNMNLIKYGWVLIPSSPVMDELLGLNDS